MGLFRSLRGLVLVVGLSLGLWAGCQQPGGAPSGDPSASPSAPVTPGAPSTPVRLETIDVQQGEGESVDEAGATMVDVKIWQDKFDGTPFGPGQVSLMLAPEITSLPGLSQAIQGMKKGGVRRVSLQAKDLFAQLPPQAQVDPNQVFYLEITPKEVYAREPFEITTTRPGQGEKAAALGDAIKVHYVGKLDGFDSNKVFDSSRERKEPFPVKLGAGQVIPGWEKGLEGMKKGEIRRLSIPHYLAYGDRAQGDKIPAKSRLFFEVELLDFVVPGELKTTVKKPGKGEEIASGQTGDFHYTGWTDGFQGKQKFDSSRDRGQPISVQLGAGQVIQGWDQGLQGMKPGEVRLLEIPYNLAYGEQGRPPTIPPMATLYFEVEFVGLAAPPTPTAAPPKATPATPATP